MSMVTWCRYLCLDGSGRIQMKAENLNATVESMFYILRFGNMLTEVKKYGLSPPFSLL